MSDPTSTRIPSETQELLSRSGGYRLLAALFRHPRINGGKSFLLELTEAWKEGLPALRTSRREELERRTGNLLDTLRKTDDETWILCYESSYGHTANARVPAYEIEYGEEHSHRQPQELADIAAFYRAFGLQTSEKSHERPDHISVECEFMHFLLYKEAYAREQGEEEHRTISREAGLRFLSDHLAKWLPAFACRLSKFSGEGFMKETAGFALSFILSECEAGGIEAGDQGLALRAIQEKEEVDCVSCRLGPLAGGRGEGR